MLDEFELTGSVTYLIRRAHVRADALFAEIMDAPDLTPRQAALLVASYQHPGATVADLADAISIDRNTVAEMASRLVKRGLLQRERSKTDARAWSIFATDAAVEILERVMERNALWMERVFEPVPPEYRALLVKSLRMMIGLGADDADRDDTT